MAREEASPLTALEILRSGAKLLWRSCMSMIPVSIIILVLGSLGNVVTSSAIASATSRFLSKKDRLIRMDIDDRNFGILFKGLINDFQEIARALIVLSVINYLLYSFIFMVLAYAVAMIERSRKVGLKDLLLKIRTVWIGVLATSLYVFFLISGYLGFCGFLLSSVVFFAGFSIPSFALIAPMAVLELLLFQYLGTIWSQGVVVSVLEEGQSGLNALGRAAERIGGKKELCFRLSVLLLLVELVAQILISITTHLLQLSDLTETVTSSFIFQLVAMYVLAVNVVFYFECQESQEDARPMKENIAYRRAAREEP